MKGLGTLGAIILAAFIAGGTVLAFAVLAITTLT